MSDEVKKCGVVAILGRPSVGKSTFLNSVCDQKVSIVSEIPQTTRNSIRGIYNDERGQLIFIDTPGYHLSEKKFNSKLGTIARHALQDADAILYMVDSTRKMGKEEDAICEMLQPFAEKTILALNKIDREDSYAGMSSIFISGSLKGLSSSQIVRISAKEKTDMASVLEKLFSIVPCGDILYPEDCYTDQAPDFRIAEIIREQAIIRVREEIPHSLYVEIADMEWEKPGKILWVRAFLTVEAESQKPILIGKGASVIKEIRIESMKALRKIFDYRVHLDLKVKVNKKWRSRDKLLDRLIY